MIAFEKLRLCIWKVGENFNEITFSSYAPTHSILVNLSLSLDKWSEKWNLSGYVSCISINIEKQNRLLITSNSKIIKSEGKNS